MSKDSCNPTPSSPADFYPESECENCSENQSNECYCDMSDLTWDISVTECMASLDIIQGDTLYQVLAKIADKFCDLDCADIFMPGTYLNTGFVGTEKTCTYDITGAAFGSQCYVTINSVQYDLGVVANSADLVIALNAIGEGLWSYASNTITVTGYYVFGNLLIDDAVFSSVCTATGEYQTLCDYAGDIDDKFGVIDAEIVDINAEIADINDTNVLLNEYSDTTTTTSGAYETLSAKSYIIPADTLHTNGDKLIVEYDMITPLTEQVNNASGKRVQILFNAISLGEYTFENLIDFHKLKATITRYDNATVKIQFEDINYSGVFVEGLYIFNISYPTFQTIAGLDLTANPYTIQIQAKSINVGDIICKVGQVDILRKG